MAVRVVPATGLPSARFVTQTEPVSESADGIPVVVRGEYKFAEGFLFRGEYRRDSAH
jgi:hypothetical protein